MYMSRRLTYNKRIRTFSSPEDYRAFLAQERQKSEDGTLELNETTVCGITYGDGRTPDEYLPSHDAGDEDIKFKYNANDTVYYTPFLNPMWTKRGVYLEADEFGGYVPKFSSPTLPLPSIIDGGQITSLTSDFISQFTVLPDFNTGNVKSINTGRLSYLSLKSYWKSLVSFTYQGYNFPDSATGVVFDDYILDAPNLENFYYLGVRDFNTLLKNLVVKSSKLRDFYLYKDSVSQLEYPEILSLDSMLPLSGASLTDRLIIGGRDVTVRGLVFHYSGPGIANCVLPKFGTNDSSNKVNVSIALYNANEAVVNISDVNFYNCDFHGSTFAGSRTFAEGRGLLVDGCVSTATEIETFIPGYIRHKEGYLEVTPSWVGGVFRNAYISSPSFQECKFIFTDSTTRRTYSITSSSPVTASINGQGGEMTLSVIGNIPSLHIEASSDYVFQRVNVGDYSGYSQTVSISSSANCIRTNNFYLYGKIAAEPRLALYVNYMFIKSGYYSYLFDTFVVHTPYLILGGNNLSTAVSDMTVILEPFDSSLGQTDRQVQLAVNNEIEYINITAVPSAGQSKKVFRTFTIDIKQTTVSMATIQRVLDTCYSILSEYGMSGSGKSTLNILSMIYSQLTQEYITKTGVFDVVNEIIN